MLKLSARNCSLIFSLMGIFLNTDRSRFATPGAPQVGKQSGRVAKAIGSRLAERGRLEIPVHPLRNGTTQIGVLSIPVWPLAAAEIEEIVGRGVQPQWYATAKSSDSIDLPSADYRAQPPIAG